MRDKGLQIIRALSMLVIVAYHCVCYYGLWDQFSPHHLVNPYNELFYTVSRLALMVFVFISGILYGRSGFRKIQKRRSEELKSKVGRLLIPFCIWSLIAIALFTEHDYVKEFFSGTQHLWFLLMLFIVFCLVIGFRLNKANNYLTAGIAVAFLVAALFLPKADGLSLLTWRSVVRYMPAFLIGLLFEKKHVGQRLLNLSNLKFAAFYGCSFLALLVSGVIKSTEAGQVLLYVTFLVWVYFNYITINRFIDSSKPLNPVIESLDKHSMSIYLIHHLLLWGIFIYLPQACIFLDMHTIAGPILLFTTVLIASWTLSRILNSNKYTRLLFDFNLNKLKTRTTDNQHITPRNSQ